MSEWGPSNTTQEVEENKRRLMSSNIFGDNPPPVNQTPPRQQYNPPSPSVNRNPQKNTPSPIKSQYNYQSSAQVPMQFQGIVHQTTVPALSSFPDIQLEAPPTMDTFDFGLKPRTNARSNPKKLSFRPGNQLKQLRDSLSADMAQFSQKLHQLSDEKPLEMKTIEFKTQQQPQQHRTQNKKTNQTLEPPQSIKEETIIQHKRTRTRNTSVVNSSENRSSSLNQSFGRVSQNGIEENSPGFTTKSEFIMPDGTIYQ